MTEKDIIATFGAPRNSLTDDETTGPCKRETLIDVADRVIVRSEFVVAYEKPSEIPYEHSRGRGYLTIWVRDTDGYYYREQMLSGDNEMIKRYFNQCASHSVDRIERLIE